LRPTEQSQFIPTQNVTYFITLPYFVCKIFTIHINVLNLNVQLQVQRVKSKLMLIISQLQNKKHENIPKMKHM